MYTINHIQDKPKLSREEEITRIVKLTKKTSFKDLPRISKRISIFDNTENKNITLVHKGHLTPNNTISETIDNNKNKDKDNNNDEEKKNDDKNEDNAKEEVTNWDRISNILLTLASFCVKMDKTDKNELVFNTLCKVLTIDSNYKRTDQYDQELKDIFESNKIDECQVIRIINGCNQNNIFGAFYQLLQDYFIPNGFNGMKDVRGEFGWEIEIYFNPKNIMRILHKRQTQYCQPPNEEDKHFKVGWELDMSFTPGLTKCNSAFVRVNGIIFNQDATQEFKGQIKSKLTGGNLIFH